MTINSAPASFDDDISGDFMPTIHSSSPTASPSTTSPISTRRSTRLSSQTIVSASPQGSPMQTSQSDISIVDITSPPQSYQTMPPVKADNSSTAECPVCWQQMDVKVIQAHVDACLNGDSRIPSIPKTTTTPASGSKSSSFSFISSPHSSTYASTSPVLKVSNTLKTWVGSTLPCQLWWLNEWLSI